MDGIQCVVLKVYNKPLDKAQWLSWLERRPVTAEVTGSNPVWVVSHRIHRMIDDAVRNTPMWLNWQSS